MKAKIKRPPILYIIILAYVAAPAANILLLRLFFPIRLSTLIAHLFKGYGPLAALWMLTAPAVGAGFYFIKKWSWYLFLSHSALILVDYALKWGMRPSLYARSMSNAHNLLLLSGNLVLAFIVGYIVQRDFRAPYFQALPRSWRESARIPIHHRITLNGAPAGIDDLSAGGCFVPQPPLPLDPGDRVSIAFGIDTVRVECAGEVRRLSSEGAGIQFLGLPHRKKRDIDRTLKKRFSLRYEARLPCALSFGKVQRAASTLNVSRGGCYIQSEVHGLEKGLRGDVSIDAVGRSHRAAAEAVWINRSGEHEKPVGFGVRFLRPQGRLMRSLLTRLGKPALTR